MNKKSNTTSLCFALSTVLKSMDIPFFVTSANAPLPKLDKPFFNIRNTSSKAPGIHWIIVYGHNDDQGEVFDPLGESVLKYPQIILPFKHIEHQNYVQLQSDYTFTCGQFCLVFCFLRAYGWSFQRIVNTYFTKNIKHNEYLVRSFIRHNFKGFVPTKIYKDLCTSVIQTNSCRCLHRAGIKCNVNT